MSGIVSDPFKLIRKQKRGAYSEQITLAQSGSSRTDKQPALPACSTLRGAALLKPPSLYICIKETVLLAPGKSIHHGATYPCSKKLFKHPSAY